jgi:ketosteroid isomerase-like protein
LVALAAQSRAGYWAGMSQEMVDVVKRFDALIEGQDLMPAIRAGVQGLGANPTQDEVLALWAWHPFWRHLHPDIEWDAPLLGAAPANGAREVVRWWTDWAEAWGTYVPHTSKYRDLGEWVMSEVHVRAVAREGMPLETTFFQLWKVRDGKVAAVRVFMSEREALKATGLHE